MSRYEALEEAIAVHYSGERLTAGVLSALLAKVPPETPVCFATGSAEPRWEALSPPYPDGEEDFLWIDIGVSS